MLHHDTNPDQNLFNQPQTSSGDPDEEFYIFPQSNSITPTKRSVPQFYEKYRLKVIEDDPLDIKRADLENQKRKMKLVTDYAGEFNIINTVY